MTVVTSRAVLAVLLVLVLVPGCGPATDDRVRGPAIPEGVTGTLTLREGDLRFRPCAAEEAVPVSNGTYENLTDLVRSLGYGDGGVAAHLVLEDSTIREVRVAAPEAAGCESLLPDTELRAGGNEPFWAVEVDGDEALFRTPEEPDGIRYGEGAWQETAEGWRFEASRAPEDGGASRTLQLEIEPARCMDSMSGAWFPFVASLQRGERSYSGCAREGRG